MAFYHLPAELFEIIVEHTNPDNTINLSMVCTHWTNIMENMFEKSPHYYNFDTIQNDSFGLKMYLLKYDKIKTLNVIRINEIYGNNCLNCITYNMCIVDNLVSFVVFKELLTSYCILNNMTKPLYIKHLIESLSETYNKTDILNDMLDICLCVESFNVADYLLLLGASSNKWMNNIPMYCSTKNDYLKITNSLKYLIDCQSICLPLFLKHINENSDFPYKDDIVKYLMKNLHINILLLI